MKGKTMRQSAKAENRLALRIESFNERKGNDAEMRQRGLLMHKPGSCKRKK